jgi:hypothetical protein
MLRRIFVSLLFFTGCNEVSGPPGQVAEVKLQTQYAAQIDRGEATLIIVDQVYLDCVNEVVAFNAAVPFRFQQIDTPTGRTIRLEPFKPHSGTGTAVGQTSGTVWTLGRVVSPLVLIAGGPGGMLHFTATQQWVSSTGPQLHLFTLVHISQNALGEVKAEKIIIDRCHVS